MQRRQLLKTGAYGLMAMGLPSFAFANIKSSALNVPAHLKSNPLLDFSGLPKFSAIKPEHIQPAMEFLIQLNKDTVEAVVGQSSYTWGDFYEPLADAQDKLWRTWSAVGNLRNVASTDELFKAYTQAQGLISEYDSWYGTHEKLYQAFTQLQQSPEFAKLSVPQQTAILHELRDFRLSGIGLSAQDQERFAANKKRTSELSSQFSKNALDATDAWALVVSDVNELSGLSETALQTAADAAAKKGEQGYRFGLDAGSYRAIMSYADNRKLREQMYHAYVTRASDQGPNAGKWDNTAIINEMVALRYERAKLLGLPSYADYSLETKMAESPAQVLSFLNGLVKRARTQAIKETQELKAYGEQKLGIKDPKVWDLGYISEKQKSEKYSINDEALRPYFPIEKVLSGMFKITGDLFGISFKERHDVDVWHKDVRFFDVFKAGQHIASFYLDLYSREGKRSGAWASSHITRRRTKDGIQIPVPILVCNFSPPANGNSLILHNEAVTLFHEFGHGLHGMLSQVDVGAVSGTNGVPTDAVEFPSQLLENWVWDKQMLPLISGHYQTGEPLPSEMIDKLIEAKNYLSARFAIRQLEYGLFDMRIHHEYNPNRANFIDRIRSELDTQVAVDEYPMYMRRFNSFNHIFAGGYAAGYYGYMWADVLSADAFTYFTQRGLTDANAGQHYLATFLSKGGSEEPMKLYRDFMGREPSLEPLLKQLNIS